MIIKNLQVAFRNATHSLKYIFIIKYFYLNIIIKKNINYIFINKILLFKYYY